MLKRVLDDDSDPKGKKTVKIRYGEEECNNIFVLVGSPRIDQEEVEVLKGILRLVLVAQKLLLTEELAEITCL